MQKKSNMYQIIQPTPDDFDELTCLWEASVRATHHFIPEAYIQKLKPLVWSVYLHSMPLYMIRDNAGIEDSWALMELCLKCSLFTRVP